MERFIRVMLFAMLAFLGLASADHARTKREFDSLRPPRTVNILAALSANRDLPPFGPPPPPPPPPILSEPDLGGMP